jgi:hypothetical protein
MTEEMACPLCGQPVRSDATLRRVCNLCGMGISPEADVIIIEVGNRHLVFCSLDCLLAQRGVRTSKE